MTIDLTTLCPELVQTHFKMVSRNDTDHIGYTRNETENLKSASWVGGFLLKCWLFFSVILVFARWYAVHAKTK